MLQDHALLAFLLSTVFPLSITGLLWKRYRFDGRLALYLFTLAPFAGANGFLVTLSHSFGPGALFYAGWGYFELIPFIGGGWSVLIGVVGWLAALRIQARARFGTVARFGIGSFVGIIIGAVFLPAWCRLFGIDRNDLALWAASGACAGAVGGVIVIAFVPHDPKPLPLAHPV